MGFEPTTFRVRAEYSNPVELPIHKLTWAGYLVVMRPLRIFYTGKKRISSLDPYGTDWIFHTPLKIGGSGGYCLHTNILIKSQMPVYCSFTSIIKNCIYYCQWTINILTHFITSSTSFLKNGGSGQTWTDNTKLFRLLLYIGATEPINHDVWLESNQRLSLQPLSYD